jgi:5-methylcytosine-specific restriction endonuclease McrA
VPTGPPAPAEKLTVEQRRMLLWVACSGKCASCGSFFTVRSLVPMRVPATERHPVARLVAICPSCQQRKG